jgi:hypothetical protein
MLGQALHICEWFPSRIPLTHPTFWDIKAFRILADSEMSRSSRSLNSCLMMFRWTHRRLRAQFHNGDQPDGTHLPIQPPTPVQPPGTAPCASTTHLGSLYASPSAAFEQIREEPSPMDAASYLAALFAGLPDTAGLTEEACHTKIRVEN